jgi:hypothetical protein
VETLAFIVHNLPIIGERTLEHISIVGVAVGWRSSPVFPWVLR